MDGWMDGWIGFLRLILYIMPEIVKVYQQGHMACIKEIICLG